MEVLLEAVDGEAPPADTFVSMRIGDVQKQSRFANTRTYRFPDPGDGRGGFGRIEVFKRVGHLTVSFDSVDGEAQEVTVPCDGETLLRMRLAVKGVAEEKEKALGPEKKFRTRQRLDAAQKYLSDHRLEEVLAEAMREVIAVKPGDPHGFLSDQILKHRGEVKGGFPEALKPEAAVKAIPPPKDLPLKSAPILPESTLKSAPPLPGAHKTAPPEPEAQKGAPVLPPRMPQAHKAAPTSVPEALPDAQKLAPPLLREAQKSVPPQETVPTAATGAVQAPAALFESFTEYYAAHFHSQAAPELSALHAKFARPEPREAAPGSGPAAVKAPAALFESFSEYYAAHFHSQAAPALSALHAKFTRPEPREAATGSGPAALKASDVPSEQFSGYYAAHFCSLDTRELDALHAKFAQPVPKESTAEAPAKVAAEASAAPEQGVGRYSGSALTSLHQNFVRRAKEPAALKATAAPARVFAHRPSVGTWKLAKRKAVTEALLEETPEAEARRQFVFRPSVGSWLARGRNQALKSVLRSTEAAPREAAPPAPAEALKSVPPAMKGERAGDSPPPATEPSIGQAFAADAKLPLALRPSVGTWLVRCRPLGGHFERAPAAKSRQPIVVKQPFAVRQIPDQAAQQEQLVELLPQLPQLKKQSPPPRELPQLEKHAALGSSEAQKSAPLPHEATQLVKRVAAASWEALKLQEALAAKVREPFAFRPSVGSWLTHRRPKAPAVVAAHAAVALPAAVAAVLPTLGVELEPFLFRPSVGSWLMTQCHKEVVQREAEPPPTDASLAAPSLFHHKPSVGSWLATPHPRKVQQPWYHDIEKEFDVPEEKAHIVELQKIIAQKDNELEKLRARMRKYGLSEFSRPCSPSVMDSPEAGKAMNLIMRNDRPSPRAVALLRSKATSPTARALLENVEGSDLEVEGSLCSGYESCATWATGEAYEKLHSKFEDRPEPEKIHMRDLAAKASAERLGQFAFLPSVGSWHGARMSKSQLEALKEAALLEAAREAHTAPTSAPAEGSDEAEGMPLLIPVSDSEYEWPLSPSVGTWLVRAPRVQKPVKARRPRVHRILERRKSSLQKIEPEAVIEAFREEIAKKDDEIRELKRILSML